MVNLISLRAITSERTQLCLCIFTMRKWVLSIATFLICQRSRFRPSIIT